MLRLLSRHHGLNLPPRRPVTSPLSRPGPRPQIFPRRRNGTTSKTTAPANPPEDLLWWEKGPRWRRVVSSLIVGVKLLAFLHLIASKVILISQIDGPSMLPTLPTSGSVIVNNLYSRGRGVKVGDLIAAHRPDDMDVLLLKRVIGMPGDYVVVDPMAAGRGEETMMVRVPQGHCWITGDNMSHSIDSRFYGPVPLALVMGKVIAQASGGWKWFTAGPFTRVQAGE
ncbi:hypothetical protein ABW20_dc0105397 [Dactylellina cionopaga]|nr:hypothetical protein ABW20_dc0105397 [Dactylellina cionopaga]